MSQTRIQPSVSYWDSLRDQYHIVVGDEAFTKAFFLAHTLGADQGYESIDQHFAQLWELVRIARGEANKKGR